MSHIDWDDDFGYGWNEYSSDWDKELSCWDNEFSDEDDVEYQRPSIPPVPADDAGGQEIPHLATLSTAEELDEAIWAALPDALIDRMLTRLPPAAFGRFRSVCKHWNELPSSAAWLREYADVARRPSCTVMCQLGIRSCPDFCLFDSPPRHVPASFFCQSEQNWFSMPSSDLSEETCGFNWEIADVDWGLVCYACYEHSGLWLCVSNPLTKAKTVLPPPFLAGAYPGETLPYKEFAKLVVDRQSKTYKIVLLMRSSKPPIINSTLVYDSATAVWTVLEKGPAVWTVLQSYPPPDPDDDRAGGCFLWKRTIFMPCGDRRVLQAFDVDTHMWRKVKIESSGGRGKRYHFVSNFDRFIIVKSFDNPNLTKPTSVLALKDDSASPFPLFKGNWVEVDVRNRAYLQNVMSVARCDTSHNDYLIFTNPHTNQWITYTFRTRTWREMPSRREKNAQYAWYDWEPRWDVGTGPDPSPILNIVGRGG